MMKTLLNILLAMSLKDIGEINFINLIEMSWISYNTENISRIYKIKLGLIMNKVGPDRVLR